MDELELTALQRLILDGLCGHAELYSVRIQGEVLVIFNGVRLEADDVRPLLKAGVIAGEKQANGETVYTLVEGNAVTAHELSFTEQDLLHLIAAKGTATLLDLPHAINKYYWTDLLRDKGYIQVTETGAFALTAKGQAFVRDGGG